MAFLANIPQPSDTLDFSQPELLSNNSQLNTSFGIDHYPFTDTSANLGFHNQVTTPIIVGAAHPTTTTTYDRFYAMQDTPNLGILQYSRGYDTVSAAPAVPTPVTSLQSPATGIALAAGATLPIFDFTGINTFGLAMLYVVDITNALPRAVFMEMVTYCNSTLQAYQIPTLPPYPTATLIIGNSANPILRIKNNSANPMSIMWTLQFLRIQT
jgi:hypothetical protein